MLAYAPEERAKPFEMLAHTVFDELRDPDCKLPNGRALPPLFNFTVRTPVYDMHATLVSIPITTKIMFSAGRATAQSRNQPHHRPSACTGSAWARAFGWGLVVRVVSGSSAFY
jgi:glycogen synthase kinase 3 beta